MSKLYLQLSCHYFATVLVIFCVIVLVIVFVFVFVLVSVIVPAFWNLLCHHLCHCWKFALAYWQSQEDIPLHRSESEDQGHWGQCITSAPQHLLIFFYAISSNIFAISPNIFAISSNIFAISSNIFKYLCSISASPPQHLLIFVFAISSIFKTDIGLFWCRLVSAFVLIHIPPSSLHTTTNKSVGHKWRTLAFCVLVLSPVLIEKKYDEKGNTTATPKSITFGRKAPAGFTPTTRFGFRWWVCRGAEYCKDFA